MPLLFVSTLDERATLQLGVDVSNLKTPFVPGVPRRSPAISSSNMDRSINLLAHSLA
jgi:hypothetical protein